MYQNQDLRDRFASRDFEVTPKSPEERLLLAVLEEALASYQGGLISKDPQRRRLYCEAERWIRADDTDSLFGFESICGTFGIDPDYIRAGLFRWKRDVLTRRANQPRRKVRREYPHGRLQSISLSISGSRASA